MSRSSDAQPAASQKPLDQQSRRMAAQNLLQEVGDDQASASSRHPSSSNINKNRSNAPSITTMKGGTGSVMFFSSVMKAGGAATVNESDVHQQLVRSGVIKATASNLGRTFAKIRAVNHTVKNDRDSLASAVDQREGLWLQQRDNAARTESFDADVLMHDMDVVTNTDDNGLQAAGQRKRARELQPNEAPSVPSTVGSPVVILSKKRNLLDRLTAGSQ